MFNTSNEKIGILSDYYGLKIIESAYAYDTIYIGLDKKQDRRKNHRVQARRRLRMKRVKSYAKPKAYIIGDDLIAHPSIVNALKKKIYNANI